MDAKKEFKELVAWRHCTIFRPDSAQTRTAVPLEDDDVVLCAGPKSGSTWMQQILHGLRSGGSLDFDDINAVVPVLELGGLSGPGHTEKQGYAPRMFKTHVTRQDCPTGAKKIVVTRNPKDAALSFYYYFANWLFTTEEMNLDDFIDLYYGRTSSVDFVRRSWHMYHLASWYPHRNDKDVLWLHYEDLIADLKKCIGLISDFIGIGVGDEQLSSLVERQASLEFMKLHDSKFNSRSLKLSMNESAGLPKDAGLDTHLSSGKIRKGRVGESREVLSEAANSMLDDAWMHIVKPATGYDTYEEMRASINQELGRVF